MAHSKKKLIEQCLKAIEKHKIINITELSFYIPVSRATFYNKKLEKVDSIKEAIDNNKVLIKSSLRKKMYDSNSSTDRIALYKLLGTQDEKDALNGVQSINTAVTVANTFPAMPMEIEILGYEDELDDEQE